MILKVFYIFLICFFCVYTEDVPVVSTKLGKIAGVFEESYNGKTFSAFYGIPFAKPPIGVLRFQDPQPISPWSGVWNANSTDIMCAQVMHAPEPEGGSYIGDEDCLYLNIFVPSKEIDSSKKIDVIVHIHGGGLMFGSSNSYTGPDYLMDEDVILVTMNYRLGVLGNIILLT
ncbi:Carboxylesterase family [Popillia japonica]|uniref:Carboxylesterase family n=1 Tax=Popillia japonica TaxID=7064 RepID=A0AAW1JX68_POPJA